jgi:hypothetical protein
LNSIKLGRLVKSIEFPNNYYHDPVYSPAPEGTPILRDQYKRTLYDERSAGFASKLTSLMSSGFSKRAKLRVRVETDTVKTYMLENSEVWFRKATELDETKKWIEGAVGGSGVYYVVGFHTVTDARIMHESMEGHKTSGELTVPVGLSLAAVGVIVPFGNIIDPGMKGHRKASNGAETQFIAPGEQICALQYRKVSYRWLFSKEIANLKISEVPRWTVGDTWRRTTIAETEVEPDVLEVETEEFKQPEGEWEREEAEDGEVLLIRPAEDSDDF